MNSMLTRFIRSPLSLPLRRLARRVRETYYNNEVVGRMERKIAPMTVSIVDSAPRRVNLIVPEIDFRSFYGGYIAKFQLARRLVERGHRVRVLLVDMCEDDPDTWRACMERYSGLEDIVDRVEITYAHDRRTGIEFNPDDRVIATTWWTAYIAAALLESLRCRQFVYLIQEYEPFTFPLGSYYAMAHESYALPHRAVFSSALLADYFRISGIGVFASGAPWISFENAIVKFDPPPAGAGKDKRLLFYARPEAHASRNMFETGYQALARAIDQGVFNDQDWRFFGIGTAHGNMPLPGGRTLEMLGKVGLDRYREILPTHDIGLSLMYTPHPSLLPLEMAAAGLWVVTNECMNKTQAALDEISSSLIAARPTISGVTAGIAEAVRRCGDPKPPLNAVNWANDWDQAFNEDTMDKIESWIDHD